MPNNDYDSYLKNMSEDGTWGDQLVLVALANALGKTIRVVTSTTDKESVEVFVESENQQAEGARRSLIFIHKFLLITASASG